MKKKAKKGDLIKLTTSQCKLYNQIKSLDKLRENLLKGDKYLFRKTKYDLDAIKIVSGEISNLEYSYWNGINSNYTNIIIEMTSTKKDGRCEVTEVIEVSNN